MPTSTFLVVPGTEMSQIGERWIASRCVSPLHSRILTTFYRPCQTTCKGIRGAHLMAVSLLIFLRYTANPVRVDLNVVIQQQRASFPPHRRIISATRLVSQPTPLNMRIPNLRLHITTLKKR